MTSLTAIFGSTRGASGDSEKLLELYWNRAELKKEFARLRDQTYRLKEEIRNRDGARIRVQQKLEQLEKLLVDPDWVFNVVVFYQLRALDARCRARIAGFAEKVKQQREKRLKGKMLEAWNARRGQKLSRLESELADIRLVLESLEDRLQAERRRFSVMGALSRFLRRRSAARTLDGIVREIGELGQRENVLAEELDRVRARNAPDAQGLDIASKRSINFMILAFAQHLYLHFVEDDLAELSREAAEKSPGTIRYGMRPDCQGLLEIIEKRVESFGNTPLRTDELQQRARLLADTATFASTDVAVPDADSVATVYRIDASGSVSTLDANLLAADYWGLNKVLSR